MKRKLKIQSQYVNYKGRNGYKINPKLTLSGKWLYELGFNPNDNVSLVCENEIITIKKIKHGEENKID